METRKEKEILFHNKVRTIERKKDSKEYEELTRRRSFYSITRKSENFFKNYLIKHGKGKVVLDYGCGEGDTAIFLFQEGAGMVFGIDISQVSIEHAKEKADKEKIGEKISFFVMDAEKTIFPDNFFDFIFCSGILHHLDIERAFREMRRILKPGGSIICNEPLIHNPVFQLYRRRTPHLRTEWEMEHILSRKDINLAKRYFQKVEKRFFHLFTLLAVPFRNTFLFKPILCFLERIDDIVLSLPGIKWWAWKIIFILSKPKDK